MTVVSSPATPGIAPRVNVPGINRLFVASTLLGGASYTAWPGAGGGWDQLSVAGVLAIASCLAALRAVKNLLKEYRLRKNVAAANKVSIDHGSARESTFAERAAVGMHDGIGDLLGLDRNGRSVLRPPNLPWMAVEMGVGVGKTSSYVLPSILSRVLQGYSLSINDPKCELGVMLAPILRQLGYEVWFCNPAGRYLKDVGDDELNAYQALIDAVFGDDEQRKNAIRIAGDYAAIHYPSNSDEKNPYFAQGSRRAAIVAMLSQAVLYPRNCTPTSVYELLTDPERFLERLVYLAESLEDLDPADTIVDFLKVEARNLLHRAAHNPENFAAFLEGITQRLMPFNAAGHLGHYGREATRNIRDIRERQIVVFWMSPLSHMREFAGHVSLQMHNVIAACKAKPDGHPVHLVMEEALVFKVHDLAATMESMRSLGISGDVYFQSFAGLENVYGRQNALAIEAVCDVRLYAGINSGTRAKQISDMLSEVTMRRQEASYGADVKDINLASREMGRPLMKVNELLAMDRRKVWAFVRGLHPMQLRMCHYGEIAPYRDWVANSPISGTRLYGPAVVTLPGSKQDRGHA